MHSRSPPVIHRDIKPANFLLDRAWKLKVPPPPPPSFPTFSHTPGSSGDVLAACLNNSVTWEGVDQCFMDSPMVMMSTIHTNRDEMGWHDMG